MRLWSVQPRVDLPEEDDPWKPYSDKTMGFVIWAETEERARQIADEDAGDADGKSLNDMRFGHRHPWLDPKYSTCEEIQNDAAWQYQRNEYARKRHLLNMRRDTGR